MLYAHTMNAVIIGDQRQCARFIGDRNAVFSGDPGVRLDKAWAATPGFNRQAAPELEFSIDLVGLPAVDRNKPDALLLHPAHRIFAACDQKFAQVGIGPIFRDTAHVVEKLVLRISAEVGIGDFLICQVRHQRSQIVYAVVDAPERTSREAAIAASFLFRGALEDEDRDAELSGRVRGAKGRVTAADHDDVT